MPWTSRLVTLGAPHALPKSGIKWPRTFWAETHHADAIDYRFDRIAEAMVFGVSSRRARWPDNSHSRPPRCTCLLGCCNTLVATATTRGTPRLSFWWGLPWGTTAPYSSAVLRADVLRSEQTRQGYLRNENHRNTLTISAKNTCCPKACAPPTDFAEGCPVLDVVLLWSAVASIPWCLPELAGDPAVGLWAGRLVGQRPRSRAPTRGRPHSSTRCCPVTRPASWPGPTSPARVAEGYARRGGTGHARPAPRAARSPCLPHQVFSRLHVRRCAGCGDGPRVENVYAIAARMEDSLGYRREHPGYGGATSRRARDVEAGRGDGGQRDTFAGGRGSAILIVTCTSQRSRNRHVGEQLGLGQIDRRAPSRR